MLARLCVTPSPQAATAQNAHASCQQICLLRAPKRPDLEGGSQSCEMPFLQCNIGNKLLPTVLVFWNFFGTYYRKFYSMVFLGINHCKGNDGAVLPWKERIFRLQLQLFSPCYVGNFVAVM